MVNQISFFSLIDDEPPWTPTKMTSSDLWQLLSNFVKSYLGLLQKVGQTSSCFQVLFQPCSLLAVWHKSRLEAHV